MEENFDIDKHIDKIKSQMGEEQTQTPGLEDVPSDVINSLPNDEPSLENYNSQEESKEQAQQETDTDEQTPQDEQADEQESEAKKEENIYENEWQDPFGTNENDAVKKYVIYISKDFVPYVDNMNKDERSAYVNEAIQLKLDLEGKYRKWHLFKRVLRHIIVSVFTLVIAVPSLFWLADKSITATVQNYGYVQKNFEKLYKERVDREKAIKEIQTLRLGL